MRVATANGFTICTVLAALVGQCDGGFVLHHTVKAHGQKTSPQICRNQKILLQNIATKSVAADGGDVWARARATREEIKEIAATATSTQVMEPIMTQFFTARGWLWSQWRSTIVRAVLPREVLLNMGVATLLTIFLAGPGPHFAWRQSLIPRLAGVNTVWLLASSLVTFTISYFLSQAYSFW